MTNFQNMVMDAIKAFSACGEPQVFEGYTYVKVWLYRTESDYRKCRSALRRFAPAPMWDRDNLAIKGEDDKLAVWVCLTGAPKRV